MTGEVLSQHWLCLLRFQCASSSQFPHFKKKEANTNLLAAGIIWLAEYFLCKTEGNLLMADMGTVN